MSAGRWVSSSPERTKARSLPMRRRNSYTRRDLPIPGSATRSMTRSSERALSSPRSSTSNSRSRPTKALRPLACSASKRLATELGRSAVQTRTGAGMPLSSLVPRSCSSNRSPTSFRVPSAMMTTFGSAIPCRRAARFGVSPMIPGWCAFPDRIRSPTMTSPEAMPTRVCSAARVFNPVTASIS